MLKVTRVGLLLTLSASWICAGSGPASAKEYRIATATTGGTYFPMASGAASLWSMILGKKSGITVAAQATAGSVENVDLLRAKKADFAIIQGHIVRCAWRGVENYKGQPLKDLRTITALWPDVEHFVIRKDKSKKGTLADLKGLKYYVGLKGSGTERSTDTLLKALGFDTNGFSRGKLDYYETARAINDGALDGASLPGGPPVPAVSALYSAGTTEVVVLDVTKKQLKEILDKTTYPGQAYVIKRGTYPGQKRPIKTIAQPNILVVRGDIPEEVVYQLTKTLFENLAYLKQVHAMGKYLSLKTALTGLPAPLHPGAFKYFKEKRLKIPAALEP